MKKKTARDDIENSLFDALEAGDLELVGEDTFKLSATGNARAEQLLLTGTEAIEMVAKLTVADVTLSDNDRDRVVRTFQRAIAQLRHKDARWNRLVQAIYERGKAAAEAHDKDRSNLQERAVAAAIMDILELVKELQGR